VTPRAYSFGYPLSYPPMDQLGEISLRRARRPDSLASSVAKLLDDFQCPISTQATRLILISRGRTVTAEQLSRLAAYQREDFQRTRLPPPLCWAINPDGSPVIPRWWTRGNWRLLRRIRTEDARRIWSANLAIRLCLDFANQVVAQPQELVSFACGAATLALGGGQIFEIPMTQDQWLDLHHEVYALHKFDLNNLSDGTAEQHETEKSLKAAERPGADLLFGRS
jgi:hypothetical protein